MPDIYSSHVVSVDYDQSRHALIVRWKTGKVSEYADVPPTLANEVMKSWSVGTALREQIKPHFPHRYLEPTNG